MDNLLGLLGASVLTAKTIKWVAGLGYIGIISTSIAATYLLPSTTDFGSTVKGCQ